MENSLLKTSTESFGDILGNGKIYKVPIFQRDYSWDEDHWDDLWSDVQRVYQDKNAHYMGAVVFQRSADKVFLIIDGQQRFSTISLLILAIIEKIKSLNAVDSDERAELFMNKFVGQKDPVSLRYGSKLHLNENNDEFFQNRLVQFKPPIMASKLNDSEKMIWKAYQYFQKKIQELFGDTVTGEELAKFLDSTISNRLMFIQIIVENELNAYTVFETLNARGVELTATDLLKNYLFSLVSNIEGHIKLVKDQWNKITDIVGMKDFPVFLRHFLNTRQELVARDNLFKAVRNAVNSEHQVFQLLEELQKYAYIYKALGNPYDEIWKNDKDIVEYLTALKLFRVIQFKPLLMIAQSRFSTEKFKSLLRDAVAICFRYNVITKRNAKDMERAFNKAALLLAKNELNSPIDVFQKILRDIYISDNDFFNNFSTHAINTNKDKKLARYVLFSLERQLSGNSYDFEINEGTIEHILPESFSTNWEDFFTLEQHDEMKFSIGNLTILEDRVNHDLEQKPYLEKIVEYKNSQYRITNSISAAEWSPKAIKARQEQLAKIARTIWKVSYN